MDDPHQRTLAHISDLHIGRDPRTDAAAERIASDLSQSNVDAVLLTGDVTHRGRARELRRFERIFGPLAASGRLLVVPGNHDRMGDDAAARLMPEGRVAVARRDGLHVVRLDSTAPHNRALWNGHGRLEADDVVVAQAALDAAPPGVLAVLMLHHHVLPLPGDDLAEKLMSLMGWPHVAELAQGRHLLERILGRCDLVLHGHRHAVGERVLSCAGRPLRVLNAGSTTQLMRAKVIRHRGRRILGEAWLEVGSRLTEVAPQPRALEERCRDAA